MPTMKEIMQQIHTRFGGLIAEACEGTIVPPEFLAALTFNESGKDRKGWINPDATRFEPHVFRRLISLRDKGGKPYNRITQADLQGASDAAIRNLSMSYGPTQIMGWSMVKMLPGTIADLRNINRHFHLAVKRLLADNRVPGLLKRGDYASAFRIWNTGQPNGQTYHASYVPNGLNAMKIYKQLGPVEAADTSDFTTDIERVAAVDADTPDSLQEGFSNLEGENTEDFTEDAPQVQETSQTVQETDIPGVKVEQTIEQQPAPVVKTPTENAVEIASTGLTKIGKGFSLSSIVAAVGAFLQQNWLLVAVLLVIGAAVFIVIYYMKHKEKIVEAQIKANPHYFNVGFEKK